MRSSGLGRLSQVVAILFVFRIFSTHAEPQRWEMEHWAESQSCLFSGFFQREDRRHERGICLSSQSCLFSGFFQQAVLTAYWKTDTLRVVAILFVFRIFSTHAEPQRWEMEHWAESQSCLFSGFFQRSNARFLANAEFLGSQSCLFSGFFQPGDLGKPAGGGSWSVAILFVFRIFST